MPRTISWSICWPKSTSRADKEGKHRLVIEAYGYRWFRVGGLDYLLRRTDIDQPAKQSGA